MSTSSTTSGPHWIAIVPVKRLSMAKTRLHLAATGREDLALAFALDTIAALAAAQHIDRVIVVTDDRRARRAIDDDFADRTDAVLHVVPDVPDAGLNTALLHGAHTARELDPDSAVVAVSADLPALRSGEVDAFLAEAERLAHVRPRRPASFLADASGIGTTMLAAAQGHDLHPEFGRRSRAAHRSDGAADIGIHAPGARRDVDTLVDLWDARRIGVGPRTAAVLEQLPGAP